MNKQLRVEIEELINFLVYSGRGRLDSYEWAERDEEQGIKNMFLLINKVIEEAAQLAYDIDSGKYTATKTAAEAIRAMKIK